jgi:flagellar hook-basal body complex protein FliE
MSAVNGVGGATTYQAILQRVQSQRGSKAGGAAKADGTRFAQELSRTREPNGSAGVERTTGDNRIAEGVDQALQQVSGFDHNADKMVIDLATGQDTNIHNTMVELEKADIALKYAVQLRNRALTAYEELMRIQV